MKEVGDRIVGWTEEEDGYMGKIERGKKRGQREEEDRGGGERGRKCRGMGIGEKGGWGYREGKDGEEERRRGIGGHLEIGGWGERAVRG